MNLGIINKSNGKSTNMWRSIQYSIDWPRGHRLSQIKLRNTQRWMKTKIQHTTNIRCIKIEINNLTSYLEELESIKPYREKWQNWRHKRNKCWNMFPERWFSSLYFPVWWWIGENLENTSALLF